MSVRRYRGSRAATVLAAAATALGLAACSGPAGTAAPRAAASSRGAAATSPPAAAPPQADPAAVHADELGAVPVLMYHQLLAHPSSPYDQTPGQFRRQLDALYRAGFRTVTAADLVAGRIDLPAGTSPMVLTFDDSTVSQYRQLPDGSPDPQSAVGILLDVARRYGDPRPVASFYVNGHPFGGHPDYLAALHRLGMELGDHTRSHANLRTLSPQGVQAELAQGLQVITAAVPDAQVTTMALPYGVEPHDPSLAYEGSAGGTAYRFSAVLLVGANPAPSPYARLFDPLALPRIRSGNLAGDQAFTASYWLPRLLAGTVRRYVSDGDPARVSFPRSESALLAPRYAAQARPY